MRPRDLLSGLWVGGLVCSMFRPSPRAVASFLWRRLRARHFAAFLALLLLVIWSSSTLAEGLTDGELRSLARLVSEQTSASSPPLWAVVVTAGGWIWLREIRGMVRETLDRMGKMLERLEAWKPCLMIRHERREDTGPIRFADEVTGTHRADSA